jgi:hypothetical protein
LERITEKDEFIAENMRDYEDLIKRYNDNIAFVESIPGDIYRQLRQKFNKHQQQNDYEMEIELERD